MGFDFDELVRDKEPRDERERRSVLMFAIFLLLGSVSLAIALAIYRPDCLGGGFVQCWTEWSVTRVPYVLVGMVVSGIFGAVVLWTTRPRGLGLSDQALPWCVVPVIALSIGAAAVIPLMVLFPFHGPASVSIVTAIAAVMSLSAWSEIRRGRRKPVSPVAPIAPGVIPSVTVTRRPLSVPMLWVARYLWVAPLGLLLAVVMDFSDSSYGDMLPGSFYLMVTGAFLILTAVPCALSFAAYRVVRRGSAVARAMVLGSGLLVFVVYGILGWGVIMMSEGGIRPSLFGGIAMLAIALAGVGTIVWYFFDTPYARDRPARSGVDS